MADKPGSIHRSIDPDTSYPIKRIAYGLDLIGRYKSFTFRVLNLNRLDRDFFPCDLIGEMKKILCSWSGGKDSAWALHLLRQSTEFEVCGLLTTVNEKFRRVAIHGFRDELLDLQAERTGLPLWKVPLPFPCSNEEYELRMAEVYQRARQEGLEGIAFGDLFLEEIRAYRVGILKGTGLEPVFPLWGSQPKGWPAR